MGARWDREGGRNSGRKEEKRRAKYQLTEKVNEWDMEREKDEKRGERK